MEPGDTIIDGGNEWYENTERRIHEVSEKGLLYLWMGMSGGEEGARNGPSLMPGGSYQAYTNIQDILKKVAAQVKNDGPCVTYIGEGGLGNFMKMVHNRIEFGDMQLISEAYDVLKNVGGLSNQELTEIFAEWNRGELESFLIEITADIFRVKDEHGDGDLVDKILDKTRMKGTEKWTVQQAVELTVSAITSDISTPIPRTPIGVELRFQSESESEVVLTSDSSRSRRSDVGISTPLESEPTPTCRE
ncbi:6-phosphogluconate dehydrogenase, decarboxylating 1, chloroplastic-like [Carya illinoinensis]|uniref:6-phosphogluconate dehydrogenase, decarboxylating 1, chloroplastic-like n=1 Tax=Carya illinoinensis TaxID=32201 RepID=UPI001C728489|nr:6-phosphogluconate dehydrogenase, decarboxylating 1, chloroplastic-like [Carya illinoinensis]